MIEQVYSQSKNFLHKVYAWMSGGLLVTAGIAYYVSNTPSIVNYIFSNMGIVIGLFIAQIAIVMALSFWINKMSYPVAALTFLFYSALTGVTLSSIFLVYTTTSIAMTFVVCSSMFLAMALYGYFTNADLSSMGSYLMMGIIGLIVSLLLNMFFQSGLFSLLISAAGVIIFSLLTAFDVQKLKHLSYQIQGKDASKIAIFGALTLYLDFINLFLYLLRFFGQRRD